MAEPSPLYSLDVLQHAFVEMGMLRTKEVAKYAERGPPGRKLRIRGGVGSSSRRG